MKDENPSSFYIMEKLKSLTSREREVVNLLLFGKSNKQMALLLGISERTVEFHLKNIYIKLQVASRLELALKLGKPTGAISGHLVESTVVSENEEMNNGNQPAQSQVTQAWRNLISLIQKEVAMTVKNSIEDAENYLRSHIALFSLLVLFATSSMLRYIIFDVGMYFWGSYILLELLLIFGSVRLGELLNGNKPFRPFMIILIALSMPIAAAFFDQVYVLVILPYVGHASISISSIHATAQWLVSAEGFPCLSTSLSITSDAPWYLAIAEMLTLFLLSRMFGKRPDNNHLVAA